MTEQEELVRSTTRAIASIVRDVPPLRLTPAENHVLPFAPVPRRVRRVRRLPGWLAPVAAAAVVLAVAASLVVLRDIPNGRVVPAVSPASPASVPAYYVALSKPATSARNDLVVGSTRTGRGLFTVAPPKGTVFGVVTAADDDRTFIVDAVPASGAVGYATWYQLRISPGASSPARLTRLPIPAIPVSVLGAAAVSESGTELAVMLQSHQGQRQIPVTSSTLRIYSVGSGRLLRDWSTSYRYVVGRVSQGATTNDALNWVDADRAVAFSTYQFTRKTKTSLTFSVTARTIDVTAGDGDLISGSRAVTSGCDTVPVARTPSLTANGRTLLCVGVVSPGSGIQSGLYGPTVALTWSARPASAPAELRTLYKVSVRVREMPASDFEAGVAWADASGSAMIVYWGTSYAVASPRVHFGVVSQGRFVPLPTPAAGLTETDFASDVAW